MSASVDQTADQIVEFVKKVTSAMGLTGDVSASQTPDGLRVDINGDGTEALLYSRGEALRALQTIVNTAFRKQLGDAKVLVDCQGWRRDKDTELRQMARLLAEKALATGTPQ